MKTFPGASSPSTPGLRKKRSRTPLPHEIRQIAHQLINQLSVINLCGFKLQDKLQDKLSCSGKAAISVDLEILERAVEEATRWAERLSQVILEPAPPAEFKKQPPVKSAEQSNNVFPLITRR